jgi:hypothetical protein
LKVNVIDMINVRENRRDNQKWTIQKHRQHLTQDTEQISKKHNTENRG